LRKIAIIGSGQAGLLCAHALRKAGYAVTLYSDRKPEAWLSESRPTGTAARLEMALAFERELGLDHWDSAAPGIHGLHATFCPQAGNRLLTLTGRPRKPGLAIDLRLQSHRWMLDLVERGGTVAIENVTVPRLEEIAREHDLTLVATGKGGLAPLFERDAARSTYTKPQRHLAMICVKGPRLGFDGVPCMAAKFNLFERLGEAFWIPYHHKDAGPSWNCLFEARPGGPMDRFQGAKSAQETLAIAKTVVKELIPWDHDWLEDAEPSDELGWLVGSVTPVIKKPVGHLPSGKAVMALGDTAMALDPIAGQGANSGNKMARSLTESIVARGDRPFDEAWMTAAFERFFERHGRHLDDFTNLLLEPASPMIKAYLMAQYGSDGRSGRGDGKQALADAFAENFNDPAVLTPRLRDGARLRAFIRETTGSFARSVARGAAGVVRAQLRQRLGRDPEHPFVPAGAPAA
jgi:2-polyprenyl-6-methoxyphenol hydroxylase-like FAD-dependent oxidoreductase